jgi:hypothetical protein
MQPYIPVDDCCALRMLKKLKSLFSGSHPAASAIVPHIPEGERVYAVGDIHGRLDLFEQLIARIEADDLARGRRGHVVLLGDLIDPGRTARRDRAAGTGPGNAACAFWPAITRKCSSARSSATRRCAISCATAGARRC